MIHSWLIVPLTLTVLCASIMHTPNTNSVNQLRIKGFNMKGYTRSRLYIDELLNECDILCFSEHWLYENEFHKIRNNHSQYDSLIRQSNDLNSDTYSGIFGHCGVGIMWNKALNTVITPIEAYKHDRICVIKVTFKNGEVIHVVSVYLPHRSCNISSFEDVIIDLENLISDLNVQGHVIVIGDFNAHVGCEGGPRGWGVTTRSGRLMLEMGQRTGMVCVDMQATTTGPMHTFRDSRGHISYVDHCLVSLPIINCVRECKVYTSNVMNRSDHTPILLSIDIDEI